jgi:hypothetical protein
MSCIQTIYGVYGASVDYCSLGFAGSSAAILGPSTKTDGPRCILACLEPGLWTRGCASWPRRSVTAESVLLVIGWLVIVCV